MDISLLDTSYPDSLPLPLYHSICIGSAQTPTHQFDVMLGLDQRLIAEVKKFSLDEADVSLQDNTSDLKRFGTGSYETWYSKGRVPFALVEKTTGALAALVWFGPKPLGRKSMKYLSQDELQKESSVASGNWHTVVYRSYVPYRGTGIMKDFLRTATDVYLKYFPDAILWTGVSRSNPGSIALSGKLGYTIDESVSDPTWVAMVKR